MYKYTDPLPDFQMGTYCSYIFDSFIQENNNQIWMTASGGLWRRHKNAVYCFESEDIGIGFVTWKEVLAM